jgi:hypothetical protein
LRLREAGSSGSAGSGLLSLRAGRDGALVPSLLKSRRARGFLTRSAGRRSRCGSLMLYAALWRSRSDNQRLTSCLRHARIQ